MKIYEKLRKSMKIYENLIFQYFNISIFQYFHGVPYSPMESHIVPYSPKESHIVPYSPMESHIIPYIYENIWKSIKIHENPGKSIQMLFPEPSGGKSYALNSILKVPRSNSKALGSSCLGGNREAKSIGFPIDFRRSQAVWLGSSS